jgi:hypothetical protein
MTDESNSFALSEKKYFEFFEGYYYGQVSMSENMTGSIIDIKECLKNDSEHARGYKVMLATNLTKLMLAFESGD